MAAGTDSEGPDQTARTSRLIDSFYEAYNAHDAQAAAQLYAADGVHRDLATGSIEVGPRRVADSLGRFFGAIEELTWSVRSRVCLHHRAVVGYELTGTLPAREGGARRPVRLEGTHVFQVSADRLLETLDFWAPEEFQRQVSQT